jgi:predicted 3-demethylubiquinone-9 3-methyltransferase (glyoxalase superfamily)
MTVDWELDGERFIGINGGPNFKLEEAVSFSTICGDQAEGRPLLGAPGRRRP